MTGTVIGFIGLGVMGRPMAVNLAQSGARLVVWNRTPEKSAPLRALGVRVAGSAAEVFRLADVVMLMLADEQAMDQVLARGTPAFSHALAGRMVVHMGTTSAAYSCALEQDVVRAGGRYIEAPVSGSSQPAEEGRLIGMIAGRDEDAERVRPLLAALCSQVFSCGPVPAALLMKLSVNLFLITMVTGLCEAFHFADRHGLDTRLFRAIIDAGPMASKVSEAKLAKLVEQDFSVQAAITDVFKNNRLIADQGRLSGLACALLARCHVLFGEAVDLGLGSADMVAVIEAIDAGSDRPAVTG
ncbi:MAG: 2-hydroxy-3-oxopropionate reductase [Rhodocyclaceae bacterium]|nr:NAD(P)-dependent oxidoreductase [Rhodocyclaceae bacterium]MCG3186436.1 2-hydroxy-3-oxopropionate reductase [Rhodocyclaceae bacterium]